MLWAPLGKATGDGDASVGEQLRRPDRRPFLQRKYRWAALNRAIVPKLSPSEKLPVLYLLHGINSGPIEIMQRSAVGKLASIHRLIVILPEAEFSYYVNAIDGTPAGKIRSPGNSWPMSR